MTETRLGKLLAVSVYRAKLCSNCTLGTYKHTLLSQLRHVNATEIRQISNQVDILNVKCV